MSISAAARRLLSDAPLAFSLDEQCFPVAAPALLDKLNAAPEELREVTLPHDAVP